ncbi:MAG: ATP-binding protein [Chitinophagaceae bacterium]
MLPKKTGFLFLYANRVRAGYTIAFLSLLFLLAFTLGTLQKLLANSSNVVQASSAILSLESLMGNIKDAETGVRGYWITQDTSFMEHFSGSREQADSQLRAIASMWADDTVQQRKMRQLNELIQRRYDLLDDRLKHTYEKQSVMTDSMIKWPYRGRGCMDSIRRIVKVMQNDEAGLLSRYKDDAVGARIAIQAISIALLVVSLILAFYSFFTFNKENKARQIADKRTAEYRERLENRVIELRNANLELVKLRRNEKFAATGRMARTIAHEVRNPLTNINLAAEQLKEDMGRDIEDNMTLLEMISRNSNRINQLVTDLLNSTRFSELNAEKKSINILIDEALELATDRINLHHIAVVKDYSPEICDVEVDTEQMKIAFLNIIVNAIEAMEPGKGVLTLRTAGEKTQCLIYITDNGIGMDDEAQQKLFEPYFSNKPNGNGLGMTNTQKIILNHNGSISVESAPGTGTTFIISLRFPE